MEPERIVGIYSRPQAGVTVIADEARHRGGHMTLTRESLEVRPFAVEAIPWDGLGFCTTVWALRDWVRGVRPDLDVESLGPQMTDDWSTGRTVERGACAGRKPAGAAAAPSASEGQDVRERPDGADQDTHAQHGAGDLGVLASDHEGQ